MNTRETIQLLLNKIPEPCHEAYQASDIINNLLSESILVDTGYEVFLYGTGSNISYNGEVIIRGWRDIPTRIWCISLLPDGSNNSIPSNGNTIYEASTLYIPTFLTNIVFECDNTDQIIQYYHTTMGYLVIFTRCKAIDADYFQVWPSHTL